MVSTVRKLVFSGTVLTIAFFFFGLLTSVAVLGGGYLLNRIMPIGQVQASFIFLASVFTTLFFMGITSISENIRRLKDPFDNEEWWEDDGEEVMEDQVGQSWSHGLKREPVSGTPKVGRNHPCPCGSGKKFKMCCINRETDEIDNVVRF